MKQQEILRKIGNILKELSEQYEYLHAEEAHLNDLELELFAANAKFLTDHTEILRKINSQSSNIPPALPEHTERTGEESMDVATSTIEILAPVPAPEVEISLPPLVQSAITFDTGILQDTITPPAAQDNDAFTPVVIDETQPNVIADEKVEHDTIPLPAQDQTFTFTNPAQEEYTADIQEDEATEHVHQSTPRDIIKEEETYTAPVNEEPQEEQGISIGAAGTDHYDFIRHDPQVSNNDHTFSISSHTEEPAPPHVDLTPVTEEVKVEEPVFTPAAYDSAEYAEPVNIAPAEPEPTIPTPVYEEPAHFTPEPNERATEIQQPEPAYNTYNAPVTEAPKPEPEQPLTLNQRLSAQLHPQTPAHSQQGQPVADIKAAISMNDKLLFVKDLFNGYGMAYTEAIELVNRCKTFDEADRFLKSNYVVKNSWGDKPNTVDKFYAVLHRRFPA
ncbi:hypothetical protein MUGA111182_13740 [Mucilaginibacter galii]|uniref:Uncharacterized protein n=1 Tax=Mucilaginibacter galii TaxID=2005073 RepID=A0A917MZV5_9SPHI|nr:hypothetical protein [Mucilaginibacter galii]GGI49173.1 hypothetical protein GCM10011425_03850 [Mucilaginibacter galii]